MSKLVHCNPQKVDTTGSAMGVGFVLVKMSSSVLREIRMCQNSSGSVERVRASSFYIGATVTVPPKAN